MSSILTQDRLKEIFDYDTGTGKFSRRVKTAVNSVVGDEPGCVMNNGYLRMMVDGKKYQAHRLAWLYVYGAMPDGFIDHINGVRQDNRISNLRVVCKSLNAQNQRLAHLNNKSTKLLGATYHKASGKFTGAISLKGKKTHLGTFDTPEEAHEAYLTAKRKLHEGNTL